MSILEGDPRSPVIIHAPHGSSVIPDSERSGILLDDTALAAELAESTDWVTEAIAKMACNEAPLKPWAMINEISRLVVDPERLPDERELSERVGRGAVYYKTCDGKPLCNVDPEAREELLTQYFHPYAAAMTKLVDERIEQTGSAVIIDLHSYPEVPSAFENRNAPRPELCLGVDEFHTPPALIAAAREAFGGWDTAMNTPYAGCYVPLNRFGTDARVSAIMLELRRDTYIEGFEDHLPLVTYGPIFRIVDRLRALVELATEIG